MKIPIAYGKAYRNPLIHERGQRALVEQKCPLCDSGNMLMHVAGLPRGAINYCLDCEFRSDIPLLRQLVRKALDEA